jgi:hypothetical protein
MFIELIGQSQRLPLQYALDRLTSDVDIPIGLCASKAK